MTFDRLKRVLWARRHELLLLLLCLLHGWATAAHIQQDESLRSFDSGAHLEAAAHAWGVLLQRGAGGVWAVARGEGPAMWPSTPYLIWNLIGSLTGHTLDGFRLANIPFLALLMGAVFVIGGRVHSRGAGLLAAALVPLYPVIYGEARQFGVDFPAAATSTTSIAILLISKDFSRRLPAVLLGAMLGLGLLFRPGVGAVTLVPVAVLGVLALRRAGDGKAPVALNLALCAGSVLLISVVWWWGRAGELVALFWGHRGGWLAPGSGGALRLYGLMALWTWSPLMLLGLLAGLVTTIVAALRGSPRDVVPRRDEALALGVWGASCGLILLGVNLSDVHLLAPLAPLLAVLTAWGLCSMDHAPLRRLTIATLLALSLTFWGIDSFVRWTSFDLSELDYPVAIATFGLSSGPPRRDGKVVAAKQIARTLAQHHTRGRGVRLHFMIRHSQLDRRRLSWHFAPVLKTLLPELAITGDTYRYRLPASRTPYIGHASLPGLTQTIGHCYTLRFAEPNKKYNVFNKLGASERRLEGTLTLDGKKVTIGLYSQFRCPGDD